MWFLKSSMLRLMRSFRLDYKKLFKTTDTLFLIRVKKMKVFHRNIKDCQC